MKAIVIVATLVTAVCLVAERAAAATALVSAPLKGGAGGVVCSCANLTRNTIVVDFSIISTNGANNCSDQSIGAGSVEECVLSTMLARICRVRRDDGKSVA